MRSTAKTILKENLAIAAASALALPILAGQAGNSTVALLDDLRFERGFVVWSPVPGKKTAEGSIVPGWKDSTLPPVWGLAQWHSRFTLAVARSETLPDGRVRFADGAKAVSFYPPGSETAISLAVNARTEYQGKSPATGDPWPHLLAERSLLAHPSVGEIVSVPFRIRYRLTRAEIHRPEGFDPRRHTAQFVFLQQGQVRDLTLLHQLLIRHQIP